MDYRDYLPKNPLPGADVNSPYRSSNVPDSTPMTSAPGKKGIIPAPNASGLYAIYGRKNPYQGEADYLERMSTQDMGGRLGQLPGIVAAFKAAGARKKAEAIEADKAKQVDDFMARMKLYDEQQSDEATRLKNAETFEKEVAPKMNEAWMANFKETKDPNAAGKAAAEVGNSLSTERGLGTPRLINYSLWKDGTTAMWEAKTGEIRQGAIGKDGTLGIRNKNGEMVPTAPEDMLFDDYAKLEAVRARNTTANRPRSGSDPSGMLEYYDANNNLVAKTKDQKEAIANGAVFAGKWVKGLDDQGNEKWSQEMVPLSKAQLPRPAGNLANTQVDGQPPAPQAAQQAAVQYGRPTAIPTSPGSGQPQTQAAPQPQAAAQPLRRAINGRIALFDPATKAFLRYE